MKNTLFSQNNPVQDIENTPQRANVQTGRANSVSSSASYRRSKRKTKPRSMYDAVPASQWGHTRKATASRPNGGAEKTSRGRFYAEKWTKVHLLKILS